MRKTFSGEKKKPSATPVAELIRALVGRLDGEKTIGEEDIVQGWGLAVGQAAARHSKPVSLKKNTLRVVVDNPGWLQQLTLIKRSALKKLQSHFGKDKISDIRFRIGEFDS